ncbi:MAG: acyltransferase family protein [Clostridia bacterium]|nr:acyltransferase family protein [Clostridia bacterium]
MSPAKSRNSNIDALRVIAALGVVFIHAASYADILPFALFNAITRFSVPVFFMISGYCMLDKDYPVKNILSKALRFFLILLGWSAVYCVISRPENFVKELLLGPVHFWYLYTAIALYLITPMLSVFCKNADRQTYRYMLALLFISGCIINVMLMTARFPLLDEILQKTKIWAQTGFIFCYLLGGYFKKFSFSKRERFVWVTIGLIGVVASFFAILFTKSDIAISFYSPAVTASAIAVFAVVQTASNKFIQKVSVLAPYTLGIYILHILILNYVSQPLFSFMQKGFVYVLANAVVTFAISLGISYILKKIPILKKTI